VLPGHGGLGPRLPLPPRRGGRYLSLGFCMSERRRDGEDLGRPETNTDLMCEW
jgi:hypothetical protein